MAKKTFFKERTSAQIRRLDVSEVHRQHGLVRRILELSPASDALLVRSQLIPGRFMANSSSSSEAARKMYKHGNYTLLPTARTLTDALEETQLPHEIREETFDRRFGNRRESEIQALGYAFRPVTGADRRKRIVPFVWILEGARIFAYAMHQTGDRITVKPYDKARKVSEEGADVVLTIPSREAKKPRYLTKVSSIPVLDNPEKHAISLGFTSTYAEGRVPEHSLFAIRFKWEQDQEQSRAIFLYPTDVAAELGLVRHYLIHEENKIPWDMNPFAKPTQLAVNFYKKICNNVLVIDPSVRGKNTSRKLYVAEKSLLLARFIGELGTDQTMFWKPGRDPKIQDYDWNIPGLK